MNPELARTRRPSLRISTAQKQDSASTFPVELVECGGALTPDVQGSPSPTFQKNESVIWKVGKYLVLDGKEASGAIQTRKALHLETQEEFIMKVMPINSYRDLLAPYWAVGDHPHISEICEILLDSDYSYVVFRRHFEDLHSYVRRNRKLRETEAADLFSQMVAAVKHCHRNGVILRDLKLRKFVFVDAARKHLLLEGLEEAHVLADDASDRLTDKHGCLAYVSPEILYSADGYSGKMADVWSLGVVLYTMLMGKYPFHDSDVGTLFKKIRLGTCLISEHVSPLAKCLLRNLLRTEPGERLTVKEIPKHRWFSWCSTKSRSASSGSKEQEQVVPELHPSIDVDLSHELSLISKAWSELE